MTLQPPLLWDEIWYRWAFICFACCIDSSALYSRRISTSLVKISELSLDIEILNPDWSWNCNLSDKLPVLIPSEIPSPYPHFLGLPIPVPVSVPGFWTLPIPVPVPVPIFQNHSVSVLTPYHKYQIFPVPRPSSVPVPGYGYGKSTESVPVHKGMVCTVLVFWLIGRRSVLSRGFLVA